MKKSARKLKEQNKTISKFILLIVICTFFSSSGQLFLKQGISVFSFQGLLFNYQLILGILFYGLGAVLFIVSLKYVELSVAYPIISLGFIWVAILSYFFLAEKIFLIQWVGMFFIILGVFFVGRGATHA